MNGPQSLPAMLRAVAQRPETAGIVCGRETWSYARIDEASDCLGRRLLNEGVVPGDRVVILLPNSLEFVAACFAVWKARAIAVPLDRTTRPTTLARILHDCRPSVIVTESGGLSRLDELAEPPSSLRLVVLVGECDKTVGSETELRLVLFNDIMQRAVPMQLREVEPTETVSIHYTSGSTGAAKGVMHSHASWLAGASFTRDYHQVTADDKLIIPFPLHHAYAFRQLLTYILAGGQIILADDIYAALRRLRPHRPTALLLVPSACNIILDHFRAILQSACSDLRYVEVGSAAISRQRFEQLVELLPRTQVRLPYGLTEARVGFLAPGGNGRLNRIACIAPGLEVQLVDEHGHKASRGQLGQIVLRGAGLMQGYWPLPDGTRSAGVDWFVTGDLGRLDEAGQIELLGRIDDIINVGGKKVSPAEIEIVLQGHPVVSDAAVLGLPDSAGMMGDSVHAYVVPHAKGILDEAEVLEYCHKHLESHKVPSQIHVRDSLPKSPLGKTRRAALAALQGHGRQIDHSHGSQTLSEKVQQHDPTCQPDFL